VLPSLQIWKERSSEYVVSILLRPSAIPATSKQLNGQRRALKVLNKKLGASYDLLDKCSSSFERAMRIPNSQVTMDDQMVVDDGIRNRAATLAHVGQEYLEVRDQRDSLEALLNDGEAYFARQEFVKFCRSGRYRITPSNTANALAGLPFIGWRQSAKRCKKWKPAAAKGISYQVFETIRRIASSNTKKSELVRDAELWLRGRRPTESDGIAELREHWYYLRRSINALVDEKMLRRKLPFAITKEYWRRKANPSPVDLAFAEDERIRE
jgi:hypothetical protein